MKMVIYFFTSKRCTYLKAAMLLSAQYSLMNALALMAFDSEMVPPPSGRMEIICSRRHSLKLCN